MKILLVFLGLFSDSIAMPMHMPRIPGFSSKSEEMMRFNQFNFMNSPHMSPLGPMFGNGMQFPQGFPQFQMPMWPQPTPSGWQYQKPSPPSGPKRQNKTDQTQETPKPSQPQPKKSPPKRPLKQPTQAPPQPKEEAQTPQAFPPFNNGLFPFQPLPWQMPQRIPPGFGRPPMSNEEGGNPYFGYFGFHGFGGRPPYYSEEMFEQDFEKPKEKDPPKKETPATEPTTNSTVPETNSTQPNVQGPGASQGGNDTNPTGNGLNPGTNPQHGVLSPSTVNISHQGVPRTQIPWGPRQPNIYENYPNPNNRGFPNRRQWRPTGTMIGQRQNGPFYRNPQVQRGPRWNTFAMVGKQAARPNNPVYRRAYPSTARGNSPSLVGNLANFRRKPQGPNKQPTGTNIAPVGPKLGTVDGNEKIQTQREKSLGQKERTIVPTRDPTGPWKTSQNYGVNNKPNYKPPPTEDNVKIPNFNSIDQRENSFYPREDTRKVQSTDGQTQNQNLPKGFALEPRIPYEPETPQPELKRNTYHAVYPEEIPAPAREHFPAGRNQWNHQEIPPVPVEEPKRQEGPLPHPPYASRGNVFYSDYNPYDPRENSPYFRGNTWDERGDSPKTMRPPDNPLYPMNTPSQKERVPYNEEDPVDPNGDELFPGQSRWGEEVPSFKGSPTGRHYEGQQYPSNQPRDYLPYPFDNNPSKPREEFPYSEFYPWGPEENFPSYNTPPTVTPPTENRGYYVNNAVRQEENTLFPSWTSWDQRIQNRRPKEREPYFNRNSWDRTTNLYKVPARTLDHHENYLYSRNSPIGLQKNPSWHESEMINYGMQITRLNSPDREQLAYPDFIPQRYPPDQKEENLFHLSQRRPCCAGGSIGPKDKPLALQDYTPSYGLAPGEDQDSSPPYTEGSHTKHARHVISPTSILPGQTNSSEMRQPEESQNPSPFKDEVSTVRRNTPCSMKNQLDQRGVMPLPGTSSFQSKNVPCLQSDLGGDENNIMEQMFESSQPSERTINLTPEQLVIGTPEEESQPEAIQSEVEGNKGDRQQQRPISILQLPCFGSKLANQRFSGTRTPSSPFDGDSVMTTENPSTLAELVTGSQFKSVNVNTLNADEHTTFESFVKGTDPQDHPVQDCLLLQV